MPSGNTCDGTTKAGNRCLAPPRNGHSFCRHHLGQNQSELPIRNHVNTSIDTEGPKCSNDTETKGPERAFQSNHRSHQFNAPDGTQNNNTDNGNQFTGARFERDVKFYRNTNCGNRKTTNNTVHVNNETNVMEQNLPKTSEEYSIYISNFTVNNLRGFDVNYEELAKKAADLTTNSDFDQKLAHKVAILDMFDFMILCDNSTSMKSKEQLLKGTLKRLAKIANILTPSGISIRFLNSSDDENGDYDDLSLEDIEKKFKALQFEKGSRLGTVVNRKIVKPLIENAKSDKLKKPVIVMIITDGQPHKEDPNALTNAIKSCKESEAIRSLGQAAVVFIIARIGTSASAAGFLNKLENEESIRGMVYCSTDGLNNQHALPPPGDAPAAAEESEGKSIENKNMALVIELLFAALPG